MRHYLRLITLFVVLTIPLQSVVAQPALPPQEIEVTADAWSWAPPDRVRITFRVEQSGKTTTEAIKAVDALGTKVLDALKATASANLIVVSRGDDFGAGPATPTIQANTPVQARRFLGIETSALQKTGELIDAGLKAGSAAITEVSYAARDDQSSRLRAIQEATDRGKSKAEALAKSLGISLGELLSATVTEEPEGKLLRERRSKGEDIYAYSDSEAHVIVALRFAVAR